MSEGQWRPVASVDMPCRGPRYKRELQRLGRRSHGRWCDALVMECLATCRVRPSVCFHSIFRTNWPLTLTFARVRVTAIARRGLKIKVIEIDQGQGWSWHSRAVGSVRGNAVGSRSFLIDREHFLDISCRISRRALAACGEGSRLLSVSRVCDADSDVMLQCCCCCCWADASRWLCRHGALVDCACVLPLLASLGNCKLMSNR